MRHWYAVFTKPRQECQAVAHLERQGFEVYLPRMRVRRLRRGRLVWVEEPVFPRYVFLRVDLESCNTAPLRSTRGVVGLVRFGACIPPVPAALIEYLRAREPERLHSRPRFHRGDRVLVADGPLAGAEGLFETERGEDRVVILLNLLGRRNAVTVEAAHVLPAGGL